MYCIVLFKSENYVFEYLTFWSNHFDLETIHTITKDDSRRLLKAMSKRAVTPIDSYNASINSTNSTGAAPRREKVAERSMKMLSDNPEKVHLVDDFKWNFESFMHAITFHQYQLQHGKEHFILKSINFDKQKMKLLKESKKCLKCKMLHIKKKHHYIYYKKKKNQIKLKKD